VGYGVVELWLRVLLEKIAGGKFFDFKE